jgi:BirA family biotin operon repressor/biotin-[acetyl-CoA-carboxylase] ligase
VSNFKKLLFLLYQPIGTEEKVLFFRCHFGEIGTLAAGMMEIFRHGSLDSTTAECFRRFDRGQRGPFLVIADVQNQGRGQFGRSWYGADTKNLYISFGFVPRRLPQEFQNFSTVVAGKIADRLGQIWGLTFVVKSPNDIYCCGKKLCGILTESRIVQNRIIFAVTGIGLNVAGDLSKFPEALQSTATTLSACYGAEIPRLEAEVMVIEVMEKLLDEFARIKLADGLFSLDS